MSRSKNAGGGAEMLKKPLDDLFHETLVVVFGIIAVVVIGLATGTIDGFYSDLTDFTSEGVPWTHVMRQNPWLWPVGTAFSIYLIATVAKWTRRSPRTARLWVAVVALGLGFVGGHVYWAS